MNKLKEKINKILSDNVIRSDKLFPEDSTNEILQAVIDVLPKELPGVIDEVTFFDEGWNACRAEMKKEIHD